MPDPRQMDFNSNDLSESDDDSRQIDFETKNSVNCSWKEAENKEQQEDQMGIENMQVISKNKNFTFVQSEIDTEIAKNILYSDTGYQPNQQGGAHPDQDKKMKISSTKTHFTLLI